MRFHTVDDWLTYQESLHVKSIDLGLERVKVVYERLQLEPRWGSVITVAGTNGKGSCVAMLASILTQGGYQVGAYTSPHLIRYHERIAINQQPVSDDVLCAAFAQVEAARGDVALTYFEFGTLAALVIFAQTPLDAVVLEVGLGGRLDAVNIIDPDVALITALDVDHVDWLGPDRETIAREKAGIMRPGKPMVCVDPDPPQSLQATAQQLNAQTFYLNREFFAQPLSASQWRWQEVGGDKLELPVPSLTGDFQLYNAAGAIQCLRLLHTRLPLQAEDIAKGLSQTVLPGRFQVIGGPVIRILDVAHNAQAAACLAANLELSPCTGKTHAVVGMLKDKAIADVARTMKPHIDTWYLGGLDVARAAPVEFLAHELIQGGVSSDYVALYNSLQNAYEAACQAAKAGDRIVVFGSFYTVGEVLPLV